MPARRSHALTYFPTSLLSGLLVFMRLMSRLAGVGVLSAGLAVVVGAQARRAMTIQDLLVAVRISDPQLSPDGRTVVFARTTTDLATGKRNSDIWVTAADAASASQAKALLAGEKTEN